MIDITKTDLTYRNSISKMKLFNLFTNKVINDNCVNRHDKLGNTHDKIIFFCGVEIVATSSNKQSF